MDVIYGVFKLRCWDNIHITGKKRCTYDRKMSWNCDGPHFLIICHQLWELKYWGGSRHYKNIYDISIWLWVYRIQFFPPFGEILLMSNNTITTDTENDNLSDTLLLQKSIKIHTNSCEFLGTSCLFFKSWSKEVCCDDMECLCIFVLSFCLQPFVNTSGIRHSNDNRWANFPVFNHIVKFWV